MQLIFIVLNTLYILAYTISIAQTSSIRPKDRSEENPERLETSKTLAHSCLSNSIISLLSQLIAILFETKISPNRKL